MIEQVRLPDGTEAFVLPLQRIDRATLAAEFETLGPESRRRRFLAPVLHLSEAMLEQLVDDVDGIDHVALVLCVETSADVYEPVALGRMVRYADDPCAADLAVTVKDAWQGRGVATALLTVLMRERPVGVDRVVTEVFHDNEASLRMLQRLGHATVEDVGSGVVAVVVDLPPLETLASPAKGVDTSRPTVGRGLAPAQAVTRPTSALHDHSRRQALHTRDRVCGWFD